MTATQAAFRTDATSQIGTGHFMRCLTLAETLKKQGAQIRFVSRGLPPHLRDMLAAKGMQFASLENETSESIGDDLSHSRWLGTSQAVDAQATMQALADQRWDWIVVDHYALDIRWECALRSTAKQIMVIDDLADRQHDCDVLLDQNFYSDMQTRYTEKVPADCQLLIGPSYALIREEFQQLHGQIKPRYGPVKRILVFFGGVDADNYTGHAVEALSWIEISGLHVDVIIGSQHPSCEPIKEACAQHGFICHVQTDKMAELMAGADLAIGAGGSALWERCCLGLPTLVFCTADNQQKQIADAAQEGFLYAPEINTNLQDAIKKHTTALLENGHLRRLISRSAMQAVDGRGVSRIVSSLGCSGIDMRIANEDDSAKIFEWRNHPNIRSVSRNQELISWENHQKWFASVMDTKNRFLLIGQNDKIPVGVVRFDKQNEDVEVSIYLIPDANNSGQGRNLLLSAEQWIREKLPDIKCIRASVLGSNKHSHKLFLGTGYQVDNTHYMKQF